jgi:hypothetical protein
MPRVDMCVRVQAALERIADGQSASTPLDLSRFEQPQAPAAGDAASAEEWEVAVARAQVALEAQALRAINLELAAKYGVDMWKKHVGELEQLQVRGPPAASSALLRRGKDLSALRHALVPFAARREQPHLRLPAWMRRVS